MTLKMLRAKLHRARVTEADPDYVGSISIDPVLIEAVGLVPYECVLVCDIDNGARLETYVIEADRGSGDVKMNGAAARLMRRGDTIIIMGFCLVDRQEASQITPEVAILNKKNEIVELHGPNSK